MSKTKKIAARKTLIYSIDDDRVNDIAKQVQEKNRVKSGDIAPWELDGIEKKLTSGMTEEEFTEWCEKQWPKA